MLNDFTPVGSDGKHGTKEKLLRAGIIRFSEAESSGVTIDELVQSAKVAKGSFYNHFTDRAHFERDVFRRARRRMADYVVDVVGKEDDDALHIARAVCAFVGFSIDFPHEARIVLRWIFSQKLTPEDPTKFIVKLIRSGIIRRRFTVPSVEAGALVVFGIGRAVALKSLSSRRKCADLPLVRESTFMLLRALGLEAAEAMAISSQATEQLLR